MGANRPGGQTVAQSFACAAAGIAHAVCSQRNMKIHIAVAVVAIALGLALRIDAASWCAVVICIAVVLAMECANTAIEALVDVASPEISPLAKHAKDCAAGAVLVCAIGAVVVEAIVIAPYIMALFC